MGNNFATIRHQKIKNAEAFNGMKAHNNRDILASNIRVHDSHKNIIMSPTLYQNFDAFVEQKRKDIRLGNSTNGTKNRMLRKVLNKKNGVSEFGAMAQEFVFSHSPDAMSEADSINFLKRSHDFITEWFKDCEIISSVIHLDEKTPHIHVQVSYFDRVQKKFVQKDLSKQGKTDINLIREAWQTAVADDFELKKQDGSVVENHEAKSDLAKSKLKDEIVELKNDIDLYTTGHELKNEQIEQLENELSKKDIAIKIKDMHITSHLKNIKIRGDKITQLNTDKFNAEEELEHYQAYKEVAEEEIHELKKKNLKLDTTITTKDTQIGTLQAKVVSAAKTNTTQKDRITELEARAEKLMAQIFNFENPPATENTKIKLKKRPLEESNQNETNENNQNR